MSGDEYLYHPGVLYWDLPSGFGGQLDPVPPRLVVMHKTDNPRSTARGEAKYASTRPANDPSISSAHFYVDGIEIIGSVPLNYRAWSAHHFGNSNGWHIESCGMSGTFMTPADQRCAGLVRELCAAWKIPMVYVDADQIDAGAHGITGHHDIVLATGVGDHTDPGWTAQQWGQFIALVAGGDSDMAYDEQESNRMWNQQQMMDALLGDKAEAVDLKGDPTPVTDPNHGKRPNVMHERLNEIEAKIGAPAPVDPEAVRSIVREEIRTALAEYGIGAAAAVQPGK